MSLCCSKVDCAKFVDCWAESVQMGMDLGFVRPDAFAILVSLEEKYKISNTELGKKVNIYLE